MCLQIEPCDDAGGNDASDVLNNISVVNTDSGMPAIKQVNNFISHGFVTWVAVTDIINGTLY